MPEDLLSGTMASEGVVPDREFTVVLACHGAARLKPDESFAIEFGNPLAARRVTVSALTTDDGLGEPIPRGLWLSVHGPATSLDAAKAEFPQVGVGVANLISFAANAFAGEPELVLGYECTSGLDAREFYHRFNAEPTGMPPQGRAIPIQNSRLFCVTALEHPTGAPRVARAIGQYHRALAYWRPGTKIAALAHLFMGVEALTPWIRSLLEDSTGMPTAQLATGCGIDISNRQWKSKLDGAIKQTVIFSGDQECYHEAKKASDGFEHGFLGFNEIRGVAETDVTSRTAAYLRQALLRGLDPRGGWCNPLMDGEYQQPLESWDISWAISGTLNDFKDADLHGDRAPTRLFRDESQVVSVSRASDGRMTYRLNTSARAQDLPPGATIVVEAREVWGPSGPTVSQGSTDDGASGQAAPDNA